MKKLIYKNKSIIAPLGLLLLSLVAIYPLFQQGFYPFHDEPQIANLYQMIRSFQLSPIPPRWAPDFTYNLGYPLFNFYYLFPFYLGSLFHLILHCSVVTSLKIVFALSIPLSAISFYYFMKRFVSSPVAFVGAIVYLFTPYRAVDLYVRGAVGEMWAFVFIPLVAASLYDCIYHFSYRRLLIGSLSVFLLIISHNLSAFLFLPFLSCLFVFSQTHYYKPQKLLLLIGPIIGGMVLSAYYWLPALIEKRYIQPSTPFNPIDHFPFLSQLILPFWGYGASVWGKGDGMSFQIGLVNLLVILIAAILLMHWRSKSPTSQIRLFIVALISLVPVIFLMNSRSNFVWQILPLGEYVQFPWRLLMFTTFISALLTGVIDLINNQLIRKGLLVGLLVVTIVSGGRYLHPEKIISVDDDYYLRRFFANRLSSGQSTEISSQYPNFSEDYLPLTIWQVDKPTTLLPKIQTQAKTVSVISDNPLDYRISVISTSPDKLTFNTLFFPGWQATINNQATIIFPQSPLGNMAINFPAGKNEIRFWYGKTPIHYLAETISLLGFCLVIIFSMRYLVLNNKAK